MSFWLQILWYARPPVARSGQRVGGCLGMHRHGPHPVVGSDASGGRVLHEELGNDLVVAQQCEHQRGDLQTETTIRAFC